MMASQNEEVLLMQRFGLSEEHYSKEISDIHMDVISRSYCKQWRPLHSYLELEEIVVSDIDRDCRHVEEIDKRNAFFGDWRKKKGSEATYQKLVYALLKTECRRDAENVCKLLAETFGTEIMNMNPNILTVPTPPVSLSASFPYLNNVPKEERDELEERLRQESGDMINTFAMLVDKTNSSLNQQGVTAANLTVLIKNSKYKKVYKAIRRKKNLDDFMIRLSNYWSFFDYEVLGLIIKCRCPNLMADLKTYEDEFKLFCSRRLCEVPESIVGIKANDSNCLYLKCDESFDYQKSSLWDIKVLNVKLSKLLDQRLALLRINKGCLELVLSSLSGMPCPLNTNQKRQLQEMGFVRMHRLHEYFNIQPTSVVSDSFVSFSTHTDSSVQDSNSDYLSSEDEIGGKDFSEDALRDEEVLNVVSPSTLLAEEEDTEQSTEVFSTLNITKKRLNWKEELAFLSQLLQDKIQNVTVRRIYAEYGGRARAQDAVGIIEQAYRVYKWRRMFHERLQQKQQSNTHFPKSEQNDDRLEVQNQLGMRVEKPYASSVLGPYKDQCIKASEQVIGDTHENHADRHSKSFTGLQLSSRTKFSHISSQSFSALLNPFELPYQAHDSHLKKKVHFALKTGLYYFNMNPHKGLEYLITKGLLDNDPTKVAKFFVYQNGLSKKMIGQFLAEKAEFSEEVLVSLVAQSNIMDKQIDEALRKFQGLFKMPEEAQKIDRIVDVFGIEYWKHCTFKGEFKSDEAIQSLSFAIMMLHTSLYHPSVASKTTRKQWISMTRGCNDGENFSKSFLLEIFDRIEAKEFVAGRDHTDTVYEIEKQILKSPIKKLSLPHRYLVLRMDVCQPSIRKRTRHQTLFLFNDILVVCGIKPCFFQDSFSLLHVLPVKFNTSMHKFGIQLYSDDRESPFQFSCNSSSDQKLLLTALDSLHEHLQHLERERIAEFERFLTNPVLSSETEEKNLWRSMSCILASDLESAQATTLPHSYKDYFMAGVGDLVISSFSGVSPSSKKDTMTFSPWELFRPLSTAVSLRSEDSGFSSVSSLQHACPSPSVSSLALKRVPFQMTEEAVDVIRPFASNENS